MDALSIYIKKAVVYGFPLIIFAVPILIYFQDQKNREQI